MHTGRSSRWPGRADASHQETAEQNQDDGFDGQREVLVRCSGHLIGEPEGQGRACGETQGDDEAGFEQEGGAYQAP